MTAYVIRYNNATAGRLMWLVFNEDASFLVNTNKPLAAACKLLESDVGVAISKRVRYKGVMRASEAAMTIADHKERSLP